MSNICDAWDRIVPRYQFHRDQGKFIVEELGRQPRNDWRHFDTDKNIHNHLDSLHNADGTAYNCEYPDGINTFNNPNSIARGYVGADVYQHDPYYYNLRPTCDGRRCNSRRDGGCRLGHNECPCRRADGCPGLRR